MKMVLFQSAILVLQIGLWWSKGAADPFSMACIAVAALCLGWGMATWAADRWWPA